MAAGDEACRFRRARVEAAALQRMPGQREREMIGDEIAVRDDVAVDQHRIVAARRGDAAIARARGAEAAIVLPDMRDAGREIARHARDERARIRSRAVVGDDHFVGKHRLRRDGCEHALERFRPVVGQDDETCPHRVPPLRSDNRD